LTNAHRRLALIAAAAIALTACPRSRREEPARAQDDEPRTRQFTVWDERFELFVEHRAPAAGEPVRLAAHVTDLATAEPRTAGPITIRLAADGSAGFEVVAAVPARPGIYAPELTFPAAGTWRASVLISADGKEHVVALPIFAVFATREEAERAEVADPPEGIAFLKEQQWKLKTRVEPVARRRLVEELRVPAVVAAPPEQRAKVAPPLSGRLVAASDRPWPKLGERVAKGDVLAWVEPPMSDLLVAVARADAEVAEARVSLEQSEAALARVRRLAEEKARTQRELEEAEFAARAARARLDAALAVQEAWRRSGLVPAPSASPLPRLALPAPIDGLVTQVAAVPGEYVRAEHAVFSLLDPRVLHVEARVPEIDLPRLAEPIEAAASVPGTDAPPSPITGAGGGRLLWRDAEIDPATRTLTLHFELPDPQHRFAIGQSLVAHLTTNLAADALALPERAIVDEDGRPVAFVQLAGETFEKRDLALGIRDRGHVEVRSGLAEGERVVVDGAYAVRLASVSTALPAHGHAH
jgi:RND family efflux transporter MFP subunit